MAVQSATIVMSLCNIKMSHASWRVLDLTHERILQWFPNWKIFPYFTYSTCWLLLIVYSNCRSCWTCQHSRAVPIWVDTSQITTHSGIISRQEYIQENHADIITHSMVTRRVLHKGKGKRMQSISSDEKVEIVTINKWKGKGKSERERSSDWHRLCGTHIGSDI